MTSPIALLAAMEQEIRLVRARLEEPTVHTVGTRGYVSGTLSGIPVVTAISGFGKVAAAATVASITELFSPDRIIFGGVAGGVGAGVAVGDIVIADELVQHDFDARPIFERFVIPSLGEARIATDPLLTEQLSSAAAAYVQGRLASEIAGTAPDGVDVGNVRVHNGLIASGDRFIDDTAAAHDLAAKLPGLLAVEMEGAAVAQVCAERGVPFAVFRSISDRADEHAEIDFLKFVDSVAAPITAGVIQELLARLDR